MRFTLDVRADALQEFAFKVSDIIVTCIHEATPHAIQGMSLVEF